MSYVYRFEIYPNLNNLESNSTKEHALKDWFNKYFNAKIKSISEVKYFLVELPHAIPDMTGYAEEVFTDSVIETLVSSESEGPNVWLQAKKLINIQLVDISFGPGVTDNSAQAALLALKLIPELSSLDMKVASGMLYFIECDEQLTSAEWTKLIYEKLANSLLHKIKISLNFNSSDLSRMKKLIFPKVNIVAEKSKLIDLNIDEKELWKLNQDNCWALSVAELGQIKKYYNGLKRSPTDVELEIIAQSWSEHCKHKIFSSEITYSEANLPSGLKKLGTFNVKGIFKTLIRGATLEIQKERKIPWLISIFHDNAGIVRFDETVDVCIKVETHNSPSALDPYGGALTGILGVNRDILGVGLGAKPIANTNVFCLAENEYFEKNKISIPLLLKNPDRIKEGVHLGVQDGGNKSGIPTVNGAFVFDRDFVGKPLVFCGTIGVIPQIERGLSTHEKRQRPGDLIVMAGGRIGKDGIHGATFSSMELLDGVPSSVVQIGDPITQKRLGDFLIEARVLGYFNSVTDNGAGGLSSSVGEMAQITNGANVHLEKALVKYPGLSPFELMVSESQERMTFSVPSECIGNFLQLANDRGVETSVIGEFNNSGFLTVNYNNEQVANIDLHFLHESLLPMKLDGHFDLQKKAPHWIKTNTIEKKLPSLEGGYDFAKILTELFQSPNIRSHENLIRKYDHEVKAATIVKPFTGSVEVGFSAPSDAGVIWMKPHGGESNNALAIASGICPKVSAYDTYLMAEYAVDEAVRNAICVGANPDEMVLVDNFCWPDPIISERNPDAALKLAQLVRASQALHDISISYGMPFVSGKDSMKNDFIGVNKNNEMVKISVPPTLLVTSMGRVPDISIIRTSEIKRAGDLVYLIGDDLLDYNSAFELGLIYGDYEVKYPLPNLDTKKQIKIYQAFHQLMKNKIIESSHDISDGGLLLSVAEKMMGTVLGIKLSLEMSPNALFAFFFNESAGRFVVTVAPENQMKFEECLHVFSFKKIGVVTDSGKLVVESMGKEIFNISGKSCLENYKCHVGEI